MFTYHIVYSEISDFDGSHCVETFATTDRAKALGWRRCDRCLDVQVSMNLPAPKSEPSAYDEIAF